MAAKFEEVRHLYEVLVRFNQDGKFQGAHAQYLDVVKKNGEVIQTSLSDAVPLSDAGLSEVISEAHAAAMDEVSRLKAVVNDLNHRLAEVTEELAALTEKEVG